LEPLGDELRRELGALGPNAAMSETTAAWPGAVGPDIARNAWPARFQVDGTLIVHTQDAVWAFELGHRAAEISSRLPGRPPLKFFPGPLPEPAAPEEAVQEPPAATLEERRQAAEWASSIEDEELRKAVATAAAASLAARPDSRRF
jgi:predicted nucleic acid-binding Zn ribbon protein